MIVIRSNVDGTGNWSVDGSSEAKTFQNKSPIVF